MKSMSSKTIRGYEVIEIIGEGGFGEVYRAFQPAVKREVAIKVILPEYANDPDFIRGFETEAELIARLEHFHIIPLYDYWREPNGAYLVTRFLRGGSLRDRLEQEGPLTPQEAVKLVQQICSALSVSHRHGVIHRDIKPGNILLDGDGNMYLSDFGISISMDTSDSEDLSELIGTPAYLSPEQVMSEKVTPQSDIYSFGIVLFEALTGQRPYPDDVSPMRLMQMAISEPIPPISDYRADLPVEVERVVFRATAKDPAKRYSDAMRLALDFRKAMADIVMSSMELEVGRLKADAQVTQDMPRVRLYDDATRTVPTLIDSDDLKVYDARFAPNPYKGLRAFQEADANDFFGRNALIDQLLFRMEGLQNDSPASRFLAVVGPSGSGKSSVVKAGVVPALREGRLSNSEHWFVIDMVPSNQPFEKLEAALLKIALDNMPGLLDQLQSDERGLLTAVERILPDNGELLLVIDQFEEFFTLVDNAATRQHFVDNMMTAIRDRRGRVRIIVTLRADFYDRPLLYEDLGRLLQQRTEVVLPLTEDELEAAIVEPAKRVGVDFEAGLVNAIVKDVGEQPGTLPLLQFALTDLFERRVGQTMTLQAYEDSGGVLGVLARRADDLYTELDEASQTIVRQVMLRLVSLGTGSDDTRRRMRRSEISIASADEEQVNAVLDLFGRYRLLTFDRDPATREPTIEVAHEALIRTWTRLREWVRESRDDMRIHRRLTIAARDWVEGDRDASYLSLGVRLVEFEQFARTTDLALSVDEQDYLAASRKHENALIAAEAELQTRVKRLRRVQYAAGLTAILAIAALIFILIQANRAQQRTKDAEAREAALAATQVFAETEIARRSGEIDNLRLLGFAQQFAAQGVRSEVTALLALRALSINYSRNADRILAQALDNLRFEAVLCPSGGAGNLFSFSDVGLTPDGRYAMVATADGGLNICDTTVGEYVNVSRAEQKVGAAAMSLDGHYVALAWDDGLVQVYETSTLNLVLEVNGGGSYKSALAFSRDADLIAAMDARTTTDSFNITIWNIETGDIVQVLDIGASNTTSFREIAFVLDSTNLAVVVGNTISIWDVETGNLVHALEMSDIQFANYAVFSPTRDMVIIGGHSDSTFLETAPDEVWDIASGELQFIIGDDDNIPYAAQFSADGQYIFASLGDETIEMWDTDTSELMLKFDAPQFQQLAVSSDNRLLVGVEEGSSSATLWDLSSGDMIFKSSASGNWFGDVTVQFSRDEQWVQFIVPNGVVRQFSTTSQSGVHRFGYYDGLTRYATFSPDGKFVLTYSLDAEVAELWEVETNTLYQSFDVGSWVSAVSISPDGRRSVSFSPDGRRIVFTNTNGYVVKGDVETGITEALMIEHNLGEIQFAYLSPDGRFGAFQSTDAYVIFRTDDRAVLAKLDTAEFATIGLARFSSDGKQFAFQQNSEVVIWGEDTGKTVFPFASEIADTVFYSISPDMRYIYDTYVTTTSATETQAHSLLIDIETGETVQTLDNKLGLFLSEDSQFVAVGDLSNDVEFAVWDIENDQEVPLPESGRNDSAHPIISPNGEQILIRVGDNQLWLSDIQTGEVIRELHVGEIVDYAFSPDGRWIVTTSEDGTARLWHTDYRELITEACSILPRDFTPEERDEFDIRDDRPTCLENGRE